MPITVELQQVGPATTEARIRDHRVWIDRPETKGGDDRGPMGGELLLAALGGCFASNLMAAIRAREAAIDNIRITVEGDLAEAPSRFQNIRMTVRADTDDAALLDKLVLMSERACITANTLKGSVGVEVRSEAGSVV